MIDDVLRCACGNWLGVRLADGRVESRHRRRVWRGRPESIVCEKCGAEWTPIRDAHIARALAG